ncbi:MAG: hypothetical protein H7X80_00760, partial [bacterium]|nr:hypothetical protein [Candidatus Kapabacteria bacterium]
TSILLCALAMVGACRNAGTVSDTGSDVPVDERALVEHEYINHAWGYSHFGVVITADGRVHGYQWDRNDTPTAPLQGPLVSPKDLASKYAHNRKAIGFVSADTLRMIQELIPKATKGTLTERQSVGADMGQHEYIAYVFDSKSKQYRKSTLRITGDWESSNTSPDAMRLADILNAVAQRAR